MLKLSLMGEKNCRESRKRTSDVEAEAPEAEAVAFWWKQKRKHLKICCFRFHNIILEIA
jgi:hypothetical protein